MHRHTTYVRSTDILTAVPKTEIDRCFSFVGDAVDRIFMSWYGRRDMVRLPWSLIITQMSFVKTSYSIAVCLKRLPFLIV